MTWTTETPKEPGWHWLHKWEREPLIWWFDPRGGEPAWTRNGYWEETEALRASGYEWAGPILPPTDTSCLCMECERLARRVEALGSAIRNIHAAAMKRDGEEALAVAISEAMEVLSEDY